jgi:hypothetical protein
MILDDFESGARGVGAKPVILQVRLLFGGRDPQVKSGAGSVPRRGKPAFSSIKV